MAMKGSSENVSVTMSIRFVPAVMELSMTSEIAVSSE